jgi:septation ring formation regulator EzrA
MLMLDKIKAFLENGANSTLIIIIVSVIGFLVILVLVLFLISLKKKKFRKQLELLRLRVQDLKQHEVIKNYASYDNLKSDQKLGIFVLRWKKEIENLIREVDAQYSMIDVLEDAINQSNYQYFLNLKNNFEKDIQELEEKANQFKDEIIEYIDMASDNRKYINKYFDMLQELKKEYLNNIELFKDNKVNIERFFVTLEAKFSECNELIKKSQFNEADNIASNIFKDIKLIENYILNAPDYLIKINDLIIPKFYQLSQIAEKFTNEELANMKIDFKKQFDNYTFQIKEITNEINSFNFNDYDGELNEIDYYLNNTIARFDKENKNRELISDSLLTQKNNLNKIENSAKNFIAIFKIVEGSYNITNKDISAIEALLTNVSEINAKIDLLEDEYNNNTKSYHQFIERIELIKQEISKLSKVLDDNLVIIDEIYQDEKLAREQITIMTEKINGTKKYLKYANLDDQNQYLQVLKQLNQELSQLYVLLGSFPIDIVKLNDEVKIFVSRVEKTTQDINRVVYKTLFAEFVLMYANRYFSRPEYQNELILAEEFFFKKQFTKAYEKAMEVLEKINSNHKKIVLDKYQEKFNEIFT